MAAHATQRWAWSQCCRLDQHMQDELHENEASLGPAVQESVLAHTTKSGGQDVGEHAPQELGDGQGAQCGLAGLGVTVAEGDGAGEAIVVEEVALVDDTPVEVAREVLQCRLATTDTATVDHPFWRQADGDRHTGELQGLQHTGAKHPGRGSAADLGLQREPRNDWKRLSTGC